VLTQLDYWYIQAGPKSLNGLFATPRLTLSRLGGPMSSLFEARTKNPGRPAFGGMTLGQCKFIFEDWKGGLVSEANPKEILEPITEDPDMETLTMESKKQPNPVAPVKSELHLAPSTFFADLTLVDEPLPYSSKLTVQANPSIKSYDWKAIPIRLNKLESEQTASSDIIS
jgi:hypothetical protein